MGSLARGQIAIQFGDVLENGHSRKGLNNVEDLLDLRLQMDEQRLALALFELFARGAKYAQPGAANKFELREVKYDLCDSLLHLEELGQLPLQFRRGGSIKAAREFHRCSGSALGTNIFLEFNFEWHIYVFVFVD